MILLSFVAGAIHILAPDHWVPLSLLSWQRGWSSKKTRVVSLEMFFTHVVFGLLFAIVFCGLAKHWPEEISLLSGLSIVGISALFRVFRFPSLKEVLRSGPQSKRSILIAWSLLGPAESLILVAFFAIQQGSSLFECSIAYGLGTLLMGTLLVSGGRSLWNRPATLPQRWFLFRWSVPFASLLVIGLLNVPWLSALQRLEHFR